LDTLRADNVRLRRLLRLSEEQARAAASDQATLTGAPASPVTMGSSAADKVRFFFELFRCRTDVYALRWENRRDGRSGWMPAIKGYWRKGMNRADAPYLPLTPEVVTAGDPPAGNGAGVATPVRGRRLPRVAGACDRHRRLTKDRMG
jgi:hypothetical protein